MRCRKRRGRKDGDEDVVEFPKQRGVLVDAERKKKCDRTHSRPDPRREMDER